MKVYLIEWQGYACCGLEKEAFSTREAAERWIAATSTKPGYYTIFEVEVKE